MRQNRKLPVQKILRPQVGSTPNRDFLELAASLDELINKSTQHEKECREFLHHMAEELCSERPNSFLRVGGTEEPTRFGFSDYVVSAEISHGGVSERRAYVWELKAPQIYLYESDDHQRRFRPSKELIKAETQLIHCVSEYQNSAAFKDYYGLGVRSKVVAAGIIMGSQGRIVRISQSLEGDVGFDERAAADYSFWLRNQYIYEKAGIRLKTWDWVVDALRQLAGKPRIDLSGQAF